MSTPRGTTAADLDSRDRVLTLVGILLALFLGALDQTIVSTALPKIVADLQGLDRYAWVATAYLLASTCLVPIYGRLADNHSRKAIELWAVGFFLGGSFLCGVAGEFGALPVLGDGMTQLIVFRGIQGLGGAGIFAMAFIVIADLYPPAQRGRYQGLVGACFGVASVLGPLLGGFLTDHAGGVIPGVEGWRWVFYVNLPFGAVALWFIVRRMPSLHPRARAGGLDRRSAALLVGGLAPLVLGLQLDKRRFPWAPGTGTGDAPAMAGLVTPGLLLLAAVALILFWRRSRRVANPILDPALFRDAVFRRANAAAFFLGGTFLVVLLFLPLFLVNVVGVSATRAGISLIPLSLGVVVGSVAAGHLSSWVGRVRALMLGAGVVLLVGVGLLATVDVDTSYGTVTAFMVVCGLGIGPSFPLYTLAIQNAVDVRRLGQATSAAQFFRQIGGTVGAALMGAILTLGVVGGLQRAGLPEVGGAPPVGRLAREGAANTVAEIQAAYRRADSLVAASAAGDPAALDALRELRLPGGPGGDELATAVRRASPGEGRPAGATSPEGLRRDLADRADRVAGDVRRAVRESFAGALARVFRWTLALVVLALLLSIRIPDHRLRETQEEELPAT